MDACSPWVAVTPSGLRRYAARLKTLARFVEPVTNWLKVGQPTPKQLF
jgi:hypothetical protein